MNNPFSSARPAWVSTALGALVVLCWACTTAQAQAPVPRQADFIVAVVNSEPITNLEVQRLRQRLRSDLAAQTPPPNAREDSDLSRMALEQLINEKAQLQVARASGIKIEEDALDQAEQNVATSNQLTRQALGQRLAQEGISASAFREQLRTQLTLSRLREREVESRVRVSDLEIAQFLRTQLQLQAAQVPTVLNLAMILIAVPENSPEPAVRALGERAADITRRARSGESFADLAKAFSQSADRGANGGQMGLRPANRYPDLFLNATRALKVGSVSDPVRSAAGFHVLQVIERQEITTLLVTQTRARHILLRPSAQLSQAQAVARLSELRKAVVAGQADFAALARELSQDGSAQQGGDLGWANPGMFVPEFEEVMNRLNPGQVGEPLVSRFGVHLIEVTDRRNAPMTEAEQRTLARNVLREKKLDEAYTNWVEEVRGRAYVEMRDPPL